MDKLQPATSKISFLVNLSAILMVTLWGLSFISTKKLLDSGLNPSQIYVCRFGIAYLCIAIITIKDIKILALKDELLFLLCGLCGGSLYFITENTAIKHTLVSNVSLIVSMAPILTAIISKVVYRKERLPNGLIIGSIIAFIGVGFVIFNSSFKLKISPIGDILSILSALSWAVYSIAIKRFTGRIPVLTITRKVFFYGIVTSIPFLLILHSDVDSSIFIDPMVLGNLIFLGLGASMSSYLIWNYLVKEIGAVRASNYLYFGPVITLISSAVILGERITFIGYIGCFLILGGVVLSDKLRRNQK